MAMLSTWLHCGELADPYSEFMIRVEETVTKEDVQNDFNAQYWEGRNTVQQPMVATFLSSLSQRILTTGARQGLDTHQHVQTACV